MAGDDGAADAGVIGVAGAGASAGADADVAGAGVAGAGVCAADAGADDPGADLAALEGGESRLAALGDLLPRLAVVFSILLRRLILL